MPLTIIFIISAIVMLISVVIKNKKEKKIEQKQFTYISNFSVSEYFGRIEQEMDTEGYGKTKAEKRCVLLSSPASIPYSIWDRKHYSVSAKPNSKSANAEYAFSAKPVHNQHN